MPVKKTQRECYEVRADHEFANITIDCWQRQANVGTKHEGTYYCGEIVIHSSFGTWGHTWGACAVPFKQFLAEVEFDYVFTKFMGTELRRFDGEVTLREVRREILEQRRNNRTTTDEAREAWDLVAEEESRIESSETDCGYALHDIASSLSDDHPMHDYFADPMSWPRCTKPDIQAVGFWRELWPLFIEAIKAESVKVAA
jgi:hypothetical protein